MRLLRTREGSRGLPLSDFRASVPLRRVGPEETGAEQIRSILWSRRTSRASNTRSALTTRRWCSIPLKEEATPGPVANRCRNGSSGAPATVSTHRACCGRSFVRIGFERRRPGRSTSEVASGDGCGCRGRQRKLPPGFCRGALSGAFGGPRNRFRAESGPWSPVSIREWLSTWTDDPVPDKESMNQVAMATVIGLVAGLAISALIVVSHDLMTLDGLVSPRVLFGSAVAALLTTTAFGRGRTHFAKKALYDFPLLALDIVMIIAAAALVGLMTRGSFSFDRWAWGWLAVILACQLVRNLRLGSQKVTGLRLGILSL